MLRGAHTSSVSKNMYVRNSVALVHHRQHSLISSRDVAV